MQKYNKRSGSILILVMGVLLLLLSSSYLMTQWAILGTKITSNHLDNKLSFTTADIVLSKIEKKLRDQLDIKDFNDKCTNGCCFFGTNKDSPTSCIFEEKNLKDNYWQHQQIIIKQNEDVQITAKYVIEFLCYTPKDNIITESGKSDNNTAMLFRITIAAKGLNGSETILQSVYKK